MQITKRGRSSIYADMAAGAFPNSVALSPRSRGWLQSDIEEWIAAKVEASRKVSTI
jgi:prophage regulatory protein